MPSLLWSKTASSQNADEESDYLIKLTRKINANKSFVEFGFHPYQFNSVSLAKNGYRGLLLDSDEDNCTLANRIFNKLGFNCTAVKHWIALDTLQPILGFVESLGGELGVLNVDIDGNDYWVLKELTSKLYPQVICVEHNASFGMRAITTPYKADFDRHTEHQSGWYHGASITAFFSLLSDNYYLVNNIAGLNLVFIRKDKMIEGLTSLTPNNAYTELKLRNQSSGTTAEEQWRVIKDLNFVQLEQIQANIQ